MHPRRNVQPSRIQHVVVVHRPWQLARGVGCGSTPVIDRSLSFTSSRIVSAIMTVSADSDSWCTAPVNAKYRARIVR